MFLLLAQPHSSPPLRTVKNSGTQRPNQSQSCVFLVAGARVLVHDQSQSEKKPAVVVCSLFVAATIITSYSNHVDNTNN
jgi:hypothetical protein